MFKGLFDKHKLPMSYIAPYIGDLLGFTGDRFQSLGSSKLLVMFLAVTLSKTVKTRFLISDCPSAHNAILGRPTLTSQKAIPMTTHLMLKFYMTSRGPVVICDNQQMAKYYYSHSLLIQKEAPLSREHILQARASIDIHLADLDVLDGDRSDFCPNRKENSYQFKWEINPTKW